MGKGTGCAGVFEVGASPRGPHLLLVPEPDPNRPDPRPLLVFFHGAGGDAEQGLRILGDAAGGPGMLLLLPTSVASTWDLLTGGIGPDARALEDALSEVRAEHARGRLAYSGFSDGASYALSLALAAGDTVEAAIAFSPGFVAPPHIVGRPRIWVSHGTADRVLPVDRCSRRVVDRLRREGYELRYEEFDGGHVVPADKVSSAVDWWLLTGRGLAPG